MSLLGRVLLVNAICFQCSFARFRNKFGMTRLLIIFSAYFLIINVLYVTLNSFQGLINVRFLFLMFIYKILKQVQHDTILIDKRNTNIFKIKNALASCGVRFRTVRRSSTLRRHVLTHHGALRFFQQRTSAVRKNLHVYSCSASFQRILKYPDVPPEPSPRSSEVSITPPPPPPEPPNSLFTGSCAFALIALMEPDVQI